MPELIAARATHLMTQYDEEIAMNGTAMPTICMRGHRVIWLYVAIALLLILGLGSRGAHASASCGGSAQTITVTMPTSISASRDAPIGTVLTNWIRTPQTNNYYSCNVSGSFYTGMAFEPLSLTKAGMTVKGPENVAYTVWNTNLAGVGIAIGIQVFANGCGLQAWSDLGTPTSFLPSPWVGTSCNANNGPGGIGVVNGGVTEMALVKTGPITTGTVTGGVLFQGNSITANTNGLGPYTVGTGTSPKSFALTSTAVSVSACTTPDVTVDLGSHQQSVFTGIGSVTKSPVGFNIAVNACPTGLTKIQYEFIPVNAVLDATNGVLALSSGSTATGIGVQLKDSSGSPLQYNVPYTLSDYNTSTGGSYTIPLKAAYYQTAPSVTPGSANAVLTFTMTYQ